MSNTLSQTPFFTPNQISGCSLWLDAADPTKLTLSGNNVTQWNDKSSNALVLTQGASAPTLGPLLNNLQTIQFTTTQSLGSTTNLLTNPAQTWFIVFNAYNNTNNNRFWLNHIPSTGLTTGGGEYFYGGNGTMWANRKSGNVNLERAFYDNVGLGVTPFNSSQWYMTNVTDSNTTTDITSFSFRIDGTSRSITIYSTSSNIISGTTSTPFYVNGAAYAGTPTTNTYFSEIILYNTALSLSQVQQVEGYLAWKWGLVSNLPSNHPYKNTSINSITTLPPQFRNIGTIPMAPSLTPFVFGFNPLNIGGCTLWLDGGDPNAFVLSGTNITTWRDKSSSANNFSTTAGTATYVNNTVIIPNGTILSASSSISLSTNLYVFIVAQLNTLTFSMVLGFTNISPAGSAGDYSIRYFSSILVGTGNSVGNTNDFANANYYVNGNFNPSFGASTYSSIHMISGQSTQSGSTGVTLSSSFNSRYFIGNIYEVLFYSSPPSTTQRQQIEGYLAWKWGLPSQLPSNHPYKNSPPGLSIPVVPQNRQLANKVFGPLGYTTGLSIWYDGADPNGNGVPPANGSSISTWVDKSGNGKNATAGNAPSFSAASLNRLGTIRFNGSSGTAYYLNTPAFDFGTSERTAFFIMTNTGPASGAGSSPIELWPLTGNGTNSLSFDAWLRANVQGQAYGATATFVKNQYYIISYRFGSTSAYEEIYGNGTIAATNTKTNGGSSYANATSGYAIGSLQNDTTYMFDGNIGEMLFYNRALTDSQRQTVEGYLAWKWGLQGNLPANHPYKKWPPPPS